MNQSQTISAHVTHVDEADVTELVENQQALKVQFEKQYGAKLSLLPFFIKALTTTLKDFPIFNAAIDGDKNEIVFKKYYNIGIAVDTPDGLIVPNIKNADKKDMITLAKELADLAQRARNRKLQLTEIKGGTCTLTNIGPLGGIFATPIINQPELCIVGLHSIKDRPVVVAGQIVIRKMMYLSISFDHQYIDGADAARFMNQLVRLVSQPYELLARL
jgi:pyruvate dehydrogenase E2 component (dihydrolipoamide acetyltransferase)